MVLTREASGHARVVNDASPDKTIAQVGRRIAALRRLRGLTQEQLASHAGVSVKYLQRVEGGRENLTIRSLARLSSLLNVEVRDLFEAPE